MTHLKSILLGIIFIIFIAVNIILQSSLWRISIEKYVNFKLSINSEWQVSIPDLKGNLLGVIQGRGMTFSHENGSVVTFGEFSIKINYFRSLFTSPTLSQLRVENINVYPILNTDSLTFDTKDSLEIEVPTELNFVIEDLRLGGVINIPINNNITMLQLKLDSRLEITQDQKEFFINEFSASINDTSGYILLRNTAFTLFETSAHFTSANGVMNGLPFDGEIHYDWTILPDLTGDIHIERYDFPEKIFENLPLKPKFSSLETFIHFESDLVHYAGDVIVKNPIGLYMKGQLSLTRHDNHFSLNRLSLDSEDTNLSLSGIYEDNGRISGNMLLTHFDLSKWITEQQQTNVNGTIMLEGTIQKNNINDISVTMEVNESELYGDRDISISGTFSYNDQIFSIDSPLSFAIGPSSVTLKGYANLQDRTLDMDLKLNDASVFLINNFWSDSLNSGYATGDLQVTGTIDNPSIRAELEFINLGYHDIFLDQIKMNVHWIPTQNGGDGFFRGKIGRGSWRKYAFDNGLVDIAFSQDGIVIQSAEFNQSENFLQISGILSPDSILTLNHMQLAYENHYFISAKPFSVEFEPDKIEIHPFEIHIDDGIASGQMTISEKIRGIFHLTNINADIMKLFTDDIRYHVSGTSFGDISIADRDDYLEVKMDLTLKNGIAARQKFSEMKLKGSLYKSLLNLEEVSLIADDRKRILISGFVPLGKIDDGDREFDFYIIFDELDMSLLTQFSQSSTFMDGKISGSFHLGGSTRKTLYNFDLYIEDAIWDRLPLGTVTTEGLFDGKRLYFNKYTSSYNGSKLSGAAFLPIDYNIASENFGEYFKDDSMWVYVTGHTKTLEFLTAYLTDVDSIIGDFEFELEVLGPRNNLIRNGYLTSKEGTIYSLQLDDPIYNVQGHAELNQNTFEWKSFAGSMVKDPSKTKKHNMFISGTMDMTEFFKPVYDLKIKGNEIHFRTLLGDIEGIVNVDLNLTGKDVIEISGIIEPIDAVMYQEFVSNSDVETFDEEGSTVINYKLTFPLTGDFALRNSQIDAYLSGELSLTKFGNKPSDFGGELYVRDGKFYYYGDVFTITEGYMVLDKKGFNPYFDISAQTKINQEQIYIQLVGHLDNPQLVLESSSGFSESDIIELLTIRSRFDDNKISAKGFGNRAQNIFGAYLERQLEKNILQVTGLSQAGIIDNVSISGAAGFISQNTDQDFTITAERQISDNLSFNYSYHRSFSLSNPTTNKVGVELRLNRYVSLVGNVDETGNMHVKYRLRYSY
mgnify:CR=1 FL=1